MKKKKGRGRRKAEDLGDTWGLSVREQARQHTFGQAEGIHLQNERKLPREVCLELVRLFAEATHNLGRRNKSSFILLCF